MKMIPKIQKYLSAICFKPLPNMFLHHSSIRQARHCSWQVALSLRHRHRVPGPLDAFLRSQQYGIWSSTCWKPLAVLGPRTGYSLERFGRTCGVVEWRQPRWYVEITMQLPNFQDHGIVWYALRQLFQHMSILVWAYIIHHLHIYLFSKNPFKIPPTLREIPLELLHLPHDDRSF